MNDYTAIESKIRAMRAKLLSPSFIQEDLTANTIDEFYRFLSSQSNYRQVMPEQLPRQIPRDELEAVIMHGVQLDFIKLYRFASIKQRQALQLFGVRYEVSFIKEVMHQMDNLHQLNLSLNPFTDYLDKNRRFHTAELLVAHSIHDVIHSFRDTIYAPFFENFALNNQVDSYNHYELESALDQYIALYVDRKARRVLKAKELTYFKKLNGTSYDLMNICIVYRLKFLFHYDETEIRPALFKTYHRLTDPVLDQLLLTNDVSSFQAIVDDLGYGQTLDFTQAYFPLLAQHKLVDQLFQRYVRALPHSMLTIFEYLEDKETEARLLIQELEKISYAHLTA
ncbi:V-type ATPase subunit [Aerococcus sanguinicola]|uniref:V-type ATPase subunit n=1 Tax=Aerococcus sanguinicola TaxID=119206 RepID=A0A0X8FCD4_9LACT|nr:MULTISPECIES: V-type ATPase subunit [Aerococcus]AMB94677.1 hypothetical protein AWM72_07875 [Aerococcus sanguinicola]OFT96575.1 hypothetical protein HMPREF3090_02205 [Aerococcus sp. HMSC23C02]PKZ23323.1 hypothetical protein CYJ28_01875 [Aerococcus sanguinicola]